MPFCDNNGSACDCAAFNNCVRARGNIRKEATATATLCVQWMPCVPVRSKPLMRENPSSSTAFCENVAVNLCRSVASVNSTDCHVCMYMLPESAIGVFTV